MPVPGALRRCGAPLAALLAMAGVAAAKTYPDPAAPSFLVLEWRSLPVKTLQVEFAGRPVTLPLQAVTSVQLRRAVEAEPGKVVAMWVELTLPDLRTVGRDTLHRFRRPGDPDVLWLRLYDEMPAGMVDRFEAQLTESVQKGLYREVPGGEPRDLRLFTLSDPTLPKVLEGFFRQGRDRRYVECRMESPQPTCSATYQRVDDGVTVEYSFGLAYLDRMDWLDGAVGRLLGSFAEQQTSEAR